MTLVSSLPVATQEGTEKSPRKSGTQQALSQALAAREADARQALSGCMAFSWPAATAARCLLWSAGILQEAMAKGEYWRLIDSQGRPPGLLGMWPSRAVSFIENHDTGAWLPARSSAAVLCSVACSSTARPCPPSSAAEALSVGTLPADAF